MTSSAPCSRGTSCAPRQRLSLEHALKLLFLYAEREPIKFERAALRWLGRYVTKGKPVTLLKAQLAATALSELRAGEREAAAKLLQGPVQRAVAGSENGR
jgi:hypothetical protein